MSRDLRLTKEQEAIRIRGLRILARMIVRAHLASLIEDAGERNGDGPRDAAGRPATAREDLPRPDGEHVR